LSSQRVSNASAGQLCNDEAMFVFPVDGKDVSVSDGRLFAIYLRDHYAGSAAGLALAQRLQRQNRDEAYAGELAALVVAIAADRQKLARLMYVLGVRPDPVKVLIARGGERLARLKRNGRLLSYSPLSRLIDLETLLLGITGKRALWAALRTTAGGLPEALETMELDQLLASAETQLEQVERLRLRAAGAVLA
jgi:hypothetical protein